MRRGFRRVLAYLGAERRTILQGFLALLVASFGNLVAGIILGTITGTLQALPGLLVLLPAAIGMRGNVFGALASRLGTSFHAGLYRPTRERTGVLYQNAYAAIVLSLAISLVLGVLAKALSELVGLTSISLLDFVVISILGGALSSLIVGAFTVLLSVLAYRREWDLDSVAAPLVTAAGDIVTIPSLFLATFVVSIRWVTPAVAGIALGITVVLTIRALMSTLPLAKRVIRQSAILLCVAGTIDILAGLVIEERLGDFLVYPVFLVMLPSFLANAGALGGVLSSRLSSKLHLGVLTPRGLPEQVAVLDAALTFIFALVMFTALGGVADLVAVLLNLGTPGPLKVIGVSLVAGLLATILATVVAYYTAAVTYRRGLDPDNYGIPMITASMDFLGVVCLVIALWALGVT